ncbi:hypothetical protein [Streptomyces sp. NBC_00105]|uniref:hypothetical protein n=1 Tax=Streptomyces sp. NBC_00105 TaxID=2903622 RepID=UPI003245D8E0
MTRLEEDVDHHFVTAMEKALGWDGPGALGSAFTRGTIEDLDLLDRLLNPSKLLDLVMRRSVTTPQFRIFQEGAELHPGRYIHPSVTRRGQAIPMADMRRVGGLMREGCTMVLDEVERSLAGLSTPDGHTFLGNACTALADAARDGLFGAWGVASWDTRSLEMVQVDDLPSPDLLMVRAGFLVGIDLLDAINVLRTAWQPGETWGMSPFGGGHRKVWEEFDLRPFLRPRHEDLSRIQAAFRASFHLPSASAMAVGTDDPGHLAQLVQTLGAEVDTAAVSQYLRALHGHRQS